MSSVDNPFRGVMLFLIALMIFAGMDVTIKYLAQHYNIPLVVAVRYIVHCALMVIFLTPRFGGQLIQTKRTGLVLVRAACLAITSLFIGLALQRIPVAEMTAIFFVAPMLVVFLAGPLLGERIGLVRGLAAITGFLGVILIVRPSSGLDQVGVVYTLVGVAAATIYMLLSRVLVETEQTITMLFYTALVGSVVFGAFLPWTAAGVHPTSFEILLFFFVGLSGALGHFFFTAAYEYAPASLLAPLNYLQLLWAALFGWLVFGQVPDQLGTLGMFVIAASGTVVALKARLTSAMVLAGDLEP